MFPLLPKGERNLKHLASLHPGEGACCTLLWDCVDRVPAEFSWRVAVPQRTQEISQLLAKIRFKYPLLGEIIYFLK